MNSQTNTMKQDNDTKTTDSLAVDSASAGSLPTDGYWWLYDEERYRWEVVKVKGAFCAFTYSNGLGRITGEQHNILTRTD